MSTFEKVQGAICSELGLEPGDVTPKSSLTDLGVDSMDRASLVLALEEVLEIEIPDDEARKFVNVSQIVKYADSRS